MSNRDRTIDLYEIVWDLLICWKPAVLAVIIITLLFTSFGYKRSIAAYEKKKSQASQENVVGKEKIMANLSEDEKTDLMFVMNLRKKIKTSEKYVDESLFMKIDPSDFKKVTTSYFVEVPEGRNANALAKAYRVQLCSEEVVKKLGKALNIEGDERYLGELLVSSLSVEDSEDAGQSILYFSINLPKSMDAEAFANVFDECVKKDVKDKVGKACPHKLTPAGTNIMSASGSDVSTQQNAQLTNVNNQKTILLNRTGAFTAAQNTAYNALIEIEEKGTSDSGETAEKTFNEKRPGFFSIKYMAVGVVLGLAFVSALAFVIRFFSTKIYHVSDVESSGVRCIGQIWKKNFSAGLTALIYDKNLYKRHHKSAGADEIVRRALSRVEACGDSDIIIINASEKVSEVSRGLMDEFVKAKGKNVQILPDITTVDMIEDAILGSVKGEKSALVLIAETGSSIRRTIVAAVDCAQIYDADLCGAVLVES